MATDPTIVQISFKYDLPAAEFAEFGAQRASRIAEVPGLRWKVWLVNEAETEGGGIYLFDDPASAQAYAEGPIVGALKSNPRMSDVSVKIFGINAVVSAITRAPLSRPAASARG